MDAIMLKPVGHEAMHALRYDQLYVLMILRTGGVLSEGEWFDKILVTGIPFLYEWFVETVDLLNVKEYIALQSSDAVEVDSPDGVRWKLTDLGRMLFGDDVFGDHR